MNVSKVVRIITIGSAIVLPVATFAQEEGFKGAKGLFKGFQGLLNTAIVIATLLAFLFFVWGIAKFIKGADDQNARTEGKQQMIWGVVALTVLVSIWGIVLFLQGELNIGGQNGGIGQIMQMFGFGGSTGASSGGGSGSSSGGTPCVIDVISGVCS